MILSVFLSPSHPPNSVSLGLVLDNLLGSVLSPLEFGLG